MLPPEVLLSLNFIVVYSCIVCRRFPSIKWKWKCKCTWLSSHFQANFCPSFFMYLVFSVGWPLLLMTEWAVKQTQMMNNALGAMFVCFPPARTKRQNFLLRTFMWGSRGCLSACPTQMGTQRQQTPRKTDKTKQIKRDFTNAVDLKMD